MRPEGMFRDEAVLHARAGRGGDGLCSFSREKYKPFGGPDGGDGGRGGSVILVASVHEGSLFQMSRQRQVRAENGRPGGSNNKSGRYGEDVELAVPVGTEVRDFERGNLLADLDADGKRVVIAEGGKGGRGNARFASATNQAPRHFEKGLPGEERQVKLELKLVADVGFIGLPNAGKSTLLSRLTAARPRVADYPFTTLDPSLGILETQSDPPTLVLADIPGLIEGASQGKGLGHQFLRHVERTNGLLHLVDCSATAADPVQSARSVRDELAAYSAALSRRPVRLVATKVEDEESEARAAALFEGMGERGLCISSVTGRGLEELRGILLELSIREPAEP